MQRCCAILNWRKGERTFIGNNLISLAVKKSKPYALSTLCAINNGQNPGVFFIRLSPERYANVLADGGITVFEFQRKRLWIGPAAQTVKFIGANFTHLNGKILTSYIDHAGGIHYRTAKFNISPFDGDVRLRKRQ